MSGHGDNLANEILSLIPPGDVRLVPVTCVSVSPFQVSIAGTESYVPAKRVADQTFELGDKGMAIWAPPLAPICFRTL
jgi:hypothetical protein